jgi:uncharacterized membrane protein YdjX (TVP38/TMEM64 family)
MAETPGDSAATRIPRTLVLRAVLLATLIALAVAAVRWTALGDLVDRHEIAALLQRLRETVWAGPALIGLYLVFAPLGIPVSPLVFAGGAVFGLLGGWLYNLIGALLGAILSFLIALFMGRDLVLHLVSDERLRRAEEILERHGFWAIVRTRFLPIPFALVNYGAALAGVPFGVFLVSSTLGMIPSLLVYTYLSSALVTVSTEERLTIVMTGGFMLLGLLLLTFFPRLSRAFRRGRGSSSK